VQFTYGTHPWNITTDWPWVIANSFCSGLVAAAELTDNLKVKFYIKPQYPGKVLTIRIHYMKLKTIVLPKKPRQLYLGFFKN
jgi:hypothetical protein